MDSYSVDVGDGGKPVQVHGEDQHQGCGDEELGDGEKKQRRHRYQSVQAPAGKHGGREAHGQGQGHGQRGGEPGQDQRILEPPGDHLRDLHVGGQGHTEIATQKVAQPARVARQRRAVQMQLFADRRHRFRGCRLTEDCLRHVAGENFGADKYQHRHHPEGYDPQAQAAKDDEPHVPSSLVFSPRARRIVATDWRPGVPGAPV